MNLDHVFKKTLVRPFAGIRKKPEVPEGLLCKCSMCKKAIVAEDVRKNFYVCPSCNGYFRVRAQERIARIADEGSFLEWDQDLVGKNPMEFEGYEEKIAAARLKTRLKEAVVTGQCTIGGEPCVLCVMDGRFMMASMGEAVGEKITRAAEEATKKKLPIIIFTCSGGARMLSKNIPHLRVDFYVINHHVYFGELTFYHNAGFSLVKPHEWNVKLGNLIKLKL